MLFPCATSKTIIAYNLVSLGFIATLLSLPQAVSGLLFPAPGSMTYNHLRLGQCPFPTSPAGVVIYLPCFQRREFSVP